MKAQLTSFFIVITMGSVGNVLSSDQLYRIAPDNQGSGQPVLRDGDLCAYRLTGTAWQKAGKLIPCAPTPAKSNVESLRDWTTDLCKSGQKFIQYEFVRSSLCGVGSFASMAHLAYGLCNPHFTYATALVWLSALCASYVTGATLKGSDKTFCLTAFPSVAGAFVGLCSASKMGYLT